MSSSNPEFDEIEETRFDEAKLREALDKTLAPLERFRIPPNLIIFDVDCDVLSGGFGEVWRGTLEEGAGFSKATVAVKMLRPGGNRKQRIRVAVELARELKIWANLDHPNILFFIGYHLDINGAVAWLVSPYMENGNIRGYLQRAEADYYTRLALVTDTAKGLAYLHTRNPPICHGDIKTDNVLVTPDFRATLCDFGLARALDSSPSGLTTSKGLRGSIRYHSPELVSEDEPQRTLFSDIWSWGCLALEILTDKIPYAFAKNDAKAITEIMAGTPPGQLEGPAPIKPIAALLSVCWSETPIARPPIQQCLKIVSLPAVQTIQTPAPKALAISSQKNPTRSRKAPPNPDPLSVPPWDHFPDLQMQGRLVVDHVWTIPRSPDWSADNVPSIYFLPDGVSLALCHQTGVYIYDIPTKSLKQTCAVPKTNLPPKHLRGSGPALTHSCISRDGTKVAMIVHPKHSADNIAIWDLWGGSLLHSWESSANSFAMTSDGRQVVYCTPGSEQLLYLWDADRQSKELLAELEFRALVLRFSNDDSCIVCAGDESQFMVFSMDSRQWLGRSDPALNVYDVIFSHDDKSIFSSDMLTGGVSQWDLRSPSPVASPTAEAAIPSDLQERALHPVRVAATGLGRFPCTLVSLKAPRAAYFSVAPLAMTRDGAWLLRGDTRGDKAAMDFLDPTTGLVQAQLDDHGSRISAVDFSPTAGRKSGLFACGDRNGKVTVWKYACDSVIQNL